MLAPSAQDNRNKAARVGQIESTMHNALPRLAARTRLLLEPIWEGVLDLAYPPRCLICEQSGYAAVCEMCYGAFLPIPEPFCNVCGRPVEGRLPCAVCEIAKSAGGWALDGARAAGVFYGPLAHAVRNLKYSDRPRLGPVLGAYLTNRAVSEELLSAAWQEKIALVVPVPLHASRERKRGYNQAALLAAPLADALNASHLPHALRRMQRTPSQVGKSAQERRQAMTPSLFAVTNPSLVTGKGVLLVDDVFTTGATLNACAGALRAAGAAPVYALTLAAGA